MVPTFWCRDEQGVLGGIMRQNFEEQLSASLDHRVLHWPFFDFKGFRSIKTEEQFFDSYARAAIA
jgi:hypothetical protein